MITARSSVGCADRSTHGYRRAVSEPPSFLPARSYLDAATVAPVRAPAREAYLAALEEGWADPRRLHREGRHARLLLDAARQAVAAALKVEPDEVVFTTSHREAVAVAVSGVLRARTRPGRLVHSAVEHSAVLSAAAAWQAATGTQPHSLAVDREGRIDPDDLPQALTAPSPADLCCLQSANGEVGTRQPLEAAAQACERAGVPLLVDAAAGMAYEPCPSEGDLVTADARAWGGVPGVGVLVVRRRTRWLADDPVLDGPERGPGEPALPAVFAAAAALQDAVAVRETLAPRLHALTGRIRDAAAQVVDTEVAGAPDDRLPHIVTFSSLYVDGEVIVEEFDRRGFAVGSGSACTSSTLRPSHVLAAMQVLTHGNVRVGLPPEVSEAEVDAFCAQLPAAVGDARRRLGVSEL